MTPTDTIDDVQLYHGDCLAVLPMLAPGSVDAVVTDPPYGLVEPRSNSNGGERGLCAPRTEEMKAKRRGGFMGKKWDSDVPGVEVWSAALNVLKPGGYALIFGGTRTYHRLACAVEDAGFEIRDCMQEFFESDRRLATFVASLNDEQRGAFEELIAPGQVLSWVYGSGFPKGKGCLKPAYEPILLCRKLGPKVLELGIDECRVGTEERTYDLKGGENLNSLSRPNGKDSPDARGLGAYGVGAKQVSIGKKTVTGRWPANVLHDGSEEVLEAFAEFGERAGAVSNGKRKGSGYGEGYGTMPQAPSFADSGTAARFFYCAKADASERWGNHPTVKPLALMRWLVKLVSKPGDTIIDPFLGSGSTIEAARGRHCIGIERDEGYYQLALRRLRHAAGKADDQLFSVL